MILKSAVAIGAPLPSGLGFAAVSKTVHDRQFTILLFYSNQIKSNVDLYSALSKNL